MNTAENHFVNDICSNMQKTRKVHVILWVVSALIDPETAQKPRSGMNSHTGKNAISRFQRHEMVRCNRDATAMGRIAVREAHCSSANLNVTTRQEAVLLGPPSIRHENVDSLPSSTCVELLQDFLHLGIFFLHCRQSLFNSFQTLLLVWLIRRSRLILLLPIMLDLLAAILDLGQTKRGRRTL
jgi:hypothetical protein